MAPAKPTPSADDAAKTLPELPAKSAPTCDLRYYLALESDVEAAPSIGRKISEQLEGVGIFKVSDLLAADPAEVASGLDDSRITASTVVRWKDEAQLMLSIPSLRVTPSKLLVAAGYRTNDEIAKAEPQELSAAILKYASTPAGQKMLRDGDPPDIEKIKSWIDAAHATSKAA